MYASVNWVSIGSGNGLSPDHAITLTNAFCQLDSWEQMSLKFESEFYHFDSRKFISMCRLPKCWRHFVQGRWVKIWVSSLKMGVSPCYPTNIEIWYATIFVINYNRLKTSIAQRYMPDNLTKTHKIGAFRVNYRLLLENVSYQESNWAKIP